MEAVLAAEPISRSWRWRWWSLKAVVDTTSVPQSRTWSVIGAPIAGCDHSNASGSSTASPIGPVSYSTNHRFISPSSTILLVTMCTRAGHSPVAANASMTMLRMVLRTSRSPVLEGRIRTCSRCGRPVTRPCLNCGPQLWHPASPQLSRLSDVCAPAAQAASLGERRPVRDFAAMASPARVHTA